MKKQCVLLCRSQVVLSSFVKCGSGELEKVSADFTFWYVWRVRKNGIWKLSYKIVPLHAKRFPDMLFFVGPAQKRPSKDENDGFAYARALFLTFRGLRVYCFS